jgi:flagellar biosynthesis regulator FlaF
MDLTIRNRKRSIDLESLKEPAPFTIFQAYTSSVFTNTRFRLWGVFNEDRQLYDDGVAAELRRMCIGVGGHIAQDDMLVSRIKTNAWKGEDFEYGDDHAVLDALAAGVKLIYLPDSLVGEGAKYGRFYVVEHYEPRTWPNIRTFQARALWRNAKGLTIELEIESDRAYYVGKHRDQVISAIEKFEAEFGRKVSLEFDIDDYDELSSEALELTVRVGDGHTAGSAQLLLEALIERLCKAADSDD